MPMYDEVFKLEKKVSQKSGKMFNRFQREYISQFSDEKIKAKYNALDQGTIGEYPENIPVNLQ